MNPESDIYPLLKVTSLAGDPDDGRKRHVLMETHSVSNEAVPDRISCHQLQGHTLGTRQSIALCKILSI